MCVKPMSAIPFNVFSLTRPLREAKDVSSKAPEGRNDLGQFPLTTCQNKEQQTLIKVEQRWSFSIKFRFCTPRKILTTANLSSLSTHASPASVHTTFSGIIWPPNKLSVLLRWFNFFHIQKPHCSNAWRSYTYISWLELCRLTWESSTCLGNLRLQCYVQSYTAWELAP